MTCFSRHNLHFPWLTRWSDFSHPAAGPFLNSADEKQLRALTPFTLATVAVHMWENTSVAHATGNETRTYTMIKLGDESVQSASGDSE